MNTGTYRQDIDAFIRETQWEVSSPVARFRMARVLEWYCRNVPAIELDRLADPALASGHRMAFRPSHGRWTMLMSWMQAINFDHEVNTLYPLNAGELLVAFRRQAATRSTHRFGHFYVRVDPKRRAASQPTAANRGIPSNQTVPTYYQVRFPMTCLATIAGDAFLAWIDPAAYPDSYAHGGNQQLFIWQAEQGLKPQFT